MTKHLNSTLCVYIYRLLTLIFATAILTSCNQNHQTKLKKQSASSNINYNIKNCIPINPEHKKLENAKMCLQENGDLLPDNEAKDKSACVYKLTGLIPCKTKDGEIFYRPLNQHNRN